VVSEQTDPPDGEATCRTSAQGGKRPGHGTAAEGAAAGRRRFLLACVLPPMLFLGGIALPLARGAETLYLRDVLNAHLEMKRAEALAWRQGYVPIIDPYRAGGQPLAGNPNALPFYPTNLLYLFASSFWALNAHFWIHLLLAPAAFFWMARRWGLAREPAWAAAVCYVMSGFYLSHMSFYNLIASATLAPALVAACLAVLEEGELGGEGERGGGPDRQAGGSPAPGEQLDTGEDRAAGRSAIRHRLRRAFLPVTVALLWALLLLGGDPLMALLAALLAASAVAARGLVLPGARVRLDAPAGAANRTGGRRTGSGLALLGAALACGTLLALPQIVEFLRILPVSFRGHKGYTPLVATVASWDPRQIGEWLIPFLFGRLDLLGPGSFWGKPFFTDTPPLYPSLYPGLLALALVAAAGRPRGRMAWWAWGIAAAGIFCSLGRFNPLVAWVYGLSGHASLRYPVKFWLPVAVGGALLCGRGFALLMGGARARAASSASGAGPAPGAAWRRWWLALSFLALVLAAVWALLNFRPGLAEGWLRQLIPKTQPAAFVANERLRWSGICLESLLVVAALAAAARWARESAGAAASRGALLLGVHALAQTLLLRPLYPTDAVAPYRVPPPALAYVPRETTVVNPDFSHLFGPSVSLTSLPTRQALWYERRGFYELYPFTGPMWRRRYELDEGPEGLDSFLTRMAAGGLRDASSEQRLRMLAAWGVGRLLLDRPLAPLPPRARLVAAVPSFGGGLYIYEVTGRAPEVFLARRILPAPHMNAGYAWLKHPAFDPERDVVIPGSGPPRAAGGGTARVVRRGPESLEVEAVAGTGGSVLVAQRAQLLYRATLDGRPAPVLTTNLHHIGVAVPAGRHRVRFWIDRASFHRSCAAAALGLAALPGLAWWGARRKGTSSP
jgi:hypothetical protein